MLINDTSLSHTVYFRQKKYVAVVLFHTQSFETKLK